MLVLSRKKNETILIDGNIEIQVIQIQGNKVRIGINAPRETRVLRGELKPFGMASTGMTSPAGENEESGFEVEICSYTAQAG